MIRTVALIALVGSASAAAADYKSAEIGCANAYNAVACDSYLTEADCNADANCLYVSEGDDQYCGLTAANEVTWDVDSAAADDALLSAMMACGALDNTAAACTGDCVVGEESCVPTATKVVTVLTADGANAGIMGYNYAEATSEATCAILETEAACTAVDACQFQSMTVGSETMSRCLSHNLVKVEEIKTYCEDNGAATYATAKAAAEAAASGADVAAPLMVVLSTLVAALAIFA